MYIDSIPLISSNNRSSLFTKASVIDNHIYQRDIMNRLTCCPAARLKMSKVKNEQG